jgi:hypothetical protein
MNGSTKPQLTTPNGRAIKFTTERLEQIQNLVERGLNRQQIAEMIGATVGSLQVTCSRLGISLRRRHTPPPAPPCGNAPPPDLVISEPAKANDFIRKLAVNAQPANFALQIQYQGRERTIAFPLSQNLLGGLAIEAHFANLSIGEMIVKLITAAVARDEI